MTRSRPAELEFTAFDDPELLSAVSAAEKRGVGWINLEPIVEEENVPVHAGPFAFLAGPLHEIPTATWIPGRHIPGGETKPTTIGLQHAAGGRVVWKLRDLGVSLPDGWRVSQDHPRRGLVVSVPAADDSASVIAWLLRATEAICAVPATGRWRASIHAGISG
jgi:hypothetical protein